MLTAFTEIVELGPLTSCAGIPKGVLAYCILVGT